MLRFNLIRSYRTSVHLVRASRRLLSTVSQQDAFLEAVPKHPGIVSLALNRPQAKNAISVNLLKVLFTLEPVYAEYLLLSTATHRVPGRSPF